MIGSRSLLSAVFAIGATIASLAQEGETTDQEKIPFKDRIWYGGGLGVSFGTVTNISLEPMAGYKITRNGKLSAGLGISYRYYRDNRFVPAYSSSTYGGKVFTRYRIIDALFVHSEFNMLNFELARTTDQGLLAYERTWVPFLLVGGGYSARIGGNTFFTVMVLWDILQDERSPFLSGEPWFSLGVGVGF